MSDKSDQEFVIENYIGYFGDVENVKKVMENCPKCQSKMLHSHLPDYKNLFIEETSFCHECDYGKRKVLHVLC